MSTTKKVVSLSVELKLLDLRCFMFINTIYSASSRCGEEEVKNNSEKMSEWLLIEVTPQWHKQSSPPENRTYQWMIEEKKKRGGVGERNEVGRCLDEHKVSVCAAGQKKDVIRRKRGSVWGWQNVERKKKTGVWVSWWCSYCDSFNLWSNEGI